MTNDTKKAIVATVSIGKLEIEGLLLPDGTYAIAAPQIARLISASPTHITKSLKRALGGDVRLTRVKTELSNNPATVLTLEQFSKALFRLALKGNKKAVEVSEVLQELSLRQLFADAFGEKFEKEERQAWLKQRTAHRKQFHPFLTKWLKKDGVTGKEYGKRVNQFKAYALCPIKPVDHYDAMELLRLNNAEVRYDILRKTGMNHADAVSYLR